MVIVRIMGHRESRGLLGSYRQHQGCPGVVQMISVKEMWERVQEMFKQPSEFERWIIGRNPQNAADLEQLYKEWVYKQYRESY